MTAAVPPQNLEAEESVLGAMMVAKGAIESVLDTGLRTDDFYRDQHRAIFKAVLALHERGEGADALTVCAELQQRGDLEAAGDKANVHQLAAAVPVAGNARHYAELVRTMAVHRDAITIGRELADAADTNGILTRSRDQLVALIERAQPTCRFEDRQPLDLALDGEVEPPDYLVDGWIERGTVTVLSGDTGAAKSFCALDLAVRVVTSAAEWVGRGLTSRHGRVVVIDEENPQRLVRSRARALGLTVEAQGHLRYFHRLGVQLGAEGADWTEWLRSELAREPADLLVIDTGIAATAPEVNDNDQVAELYVRHLRPLAADLGVAIVLLLHERKPQEGVRTNRSQATMGARSWIAQADAQLTLRASAAGEERQLEDGGYAYEKTFTLEVGKLRDGGGEIAESLRISSTLDGSRALLTARIVNEGQVRSEDARVAELTEAVKGLLADGKTWSKAQLASDLAVNRDDRTFEHALTVGVDGGTWHRPKQGYYALGEGDE